MSGGFLRRPGMDTGGCMIKICRFETRPPRVHSHESFQQPAVDHTQLRDERAAAKFGIVQHPLYGDEIVPGYNPFMVIPVDAEACCVRIREQDQTVFLRQRFEQLLALFVAGNRMTSLSSPRTLGLSQFKSAWLTSNR